MANSRLELRLRKRFVLGLMVKLKNLRQLTTGLSNRNVMVYSVQRFSDRLKTTNVFAESTRDSSIKALSAKNAVSKSHCLKLDVNVWAILNWPVQLHIFGS